MSSTRDGYLKRAALGFIELSAAELSLNAVDLTAADSTEYWSPALDLRGMNTLNIGVVIDVTTPGAAGSALIYYQRVDSSGASLGPAISLSNAIDTTAADINGHFSFGAALAPSGSGVTPDVTHCNYVHPVGRCKIGIHVTTASDAAVSTATVSIEGQA